MSPTWPAAVGQWCSAVRGLPELLSLSEWLFGDHCRQPRTGRQAPWLQPEGGREGSGGAKHDR